MPKFQSTKINIPFHVEGKEFFTSCKFFGDPSDTTKVPLVILHGGPAIPHQYMSPHECLLESKHLGDTPLIFYDQIGCGNSSRPHEADGTKEHEGRQHTEFDAENFYTVNLFSDELQTVLKHFKLLDEGRQFDLLGHSWGGMLAADYVVNRLKGKSGNLRKLILADAPASMETWGLAVKQLLDKKDKIHKEIREGLENDELEEKDKVKYTMMFYHLHVCKTLVPTGRDEPKWQWPPHLQDAFDRMLENPLVYTTMIGPSEFKLSGTLMKNQWSVIKNGKVNIQVPTLVINGADDEAQDVCVKPFFEGIEKGLVEWEKFNRSSHMPFWEEDKDKYFQAITNFLKK